MAASVVVAGGRPDTFATDAEITAFFGTHASQLRGAVAAFLPIPAAALFIWFLGGLDAQLLVAASMLARRARLLPRWDALAGYGLAAVAPASAALGGVPILLLFGWIVAAGVALARAADRAANPSQPRKEQP